MDKRYFPRPIDADESYPCRVLGERGAYIKGLKQGLFSLPELFTDYPSLIRGNAPAERLEGLAQIIAETENLSPEEQAAWIANEPLYQTGQLVKMGTLHFRDESIEMPENPKLYGDLLKYEGLPLGVGNTEQGKELQFIAIKLLGRQLFVCDRNIINRISWEQLRVQGLIFGKQVAIDGKQYLLRVPYGGDEEAGFSEWDDIVNLIGYSDDIWHWKWMHTICAEKIDNHNVRACGYSHATSKEKISPDEVQLGYGWRPILELL